MRQKTSIFLILGLLAALAGCEEDLSRKTDAELGLNAQQARGRRVYQVHCASCHSAYTTSSSKGPTMKGLYRKQYLPSGLVANDRFVEDAIVKGRRMMPALGGAMSQQDLADLVA